MNFKSFEKGQNYFKDLELACNRETHYVNKVFECRCNKQKTFFDYYTSIISVNLKTIKWCFLSLFTIFHFRFLAGIDKYKRKQIISFSMKQATSLNEQQLLHRWCLLIREFTVLKLE